jgi:hypothetical protein
MKSLAFVGIFLILIFFGYKFLSGLNTNWIGFFYINRALQNSIQSSTYKTRDECFDWIDTQLKKYGDTDSHDYECGKDCKISDSGSGLYICKETVDTRE